MRTAITASLLLMSIAMLGAARPCAPGKVATVRIRDLQFQPSSVRIKVGDSVTWTNGDDRDHTADATDRSFSSGNLKPGGTFTFHFTKAGSFDYTCSYHPRMRGNVQVDN